MFGLIPYGTNEPTPRRTFPYVTALLVAVNVGVFIYELYLAATGGVPVLNSFINHYAAIPQVITSHGWLNSSLITSLFLHAGFLHLISNLLFLMAFGDNVED